MSIKSMKECVKKHCPESLLPLIKTPYRRIRAYFCSKRAMKYAHCYQDELSREILRERMKYLKTYDKNIFLDLAERHGVIFENLNGISGSSFSGIVIVYERYNSDLRYAQRLLSQSEWSGKYRLITLKELLNGGKVADTELLFCILGYKSMNRLRDYVKAHNLHNRVTQWLYAIMGDIQYLDMFKPVDDEIVIDAGAYDGATALRFLKWGGSKIKRVYSFELDPLNIPQCEANLKGYEDRVILIPKGTWSKDDVTSMSTEGAGSHVSDEDTVTAQLTTIDSVVKDDRVTFIKMDVEGAELESLKGAKNTIIKNHPRLAICAYHKPPNLYELPEYILSLVPEYKFYLRHYCSREWETVLYATC